MFFTVSAASRIVSPRIVRSFTGLACDPLTLKSTCAEPFCVSWVQVCWIKSPALPLWYPAGSIVRCKERGAQPTLVVNREKTSSPVGLSVPLNVYSSSFFSLSKKYSPGESHSCRCHLSTRRQHTAKWRLRLLQDPAAAV